MLTILITATVMCQLDPIIKTQIVQTNQKSFEHDVQLLRMGWYDYANDRRCKAIELHYETVKE